VDWIAWVHRLAGGPPRRSPARRALCQVRDRAMQLALHKPSPFVPTGAGTVAVLLRSPNAGVGLLSAERRADRASLHALQEIEPGREVVAALEIAPDETARTGQATATALAVTALLWAGVMSGLDAENPDATVSILLAGAAVFAGVTAVLGEHRLVSDIFGATRRWLLVVTGAAFVGSVSLAMEMPDAHPVGVWLIAAAACTGATLRLAWSWLRTRA